MGTISEKLTYLNETKQELKQAINDLGGSIDEQTTFRQYANQLQNVYDNLPKTEYQEGTEVTLSNCLKGKLDFDEDNGKKVVGIGQTEQYSTTGKNLFGLGVSATDVTTTYREVANQRLDITKIGLNEARFTFRGGNWSRGYFEIDGIDGTLDYVITFDVTENTTNYTPTYTKDTTNSTSNKLVFFISGGNGTTAVDNTNHFTLSNIMVSRTSGDYEPYTRWNSSPFTYLSLSYPMCNRRTEYSRKWKEFVGEY